DQHRRLEKGMVAADALAGPDHDRAEDHDARQIEEEPTRATARADAADGAGGEKEDRAAAEPRRPERPGPGEPRPQPAHPTGGRCWAGPPGGPPPPSCPPERATRNRGGGKRRPEPPKARSAPTGRRPCAGSNQAARLKGSARPADGRACPRRHRIAVVFPAP